MPPTTTSGRRPNGQRIFYRSDHYNFAKMGIPIAFFTIGLHVDYHRPTDTPEKIDYKEIQLISKTVAAVGWQLANDPGRPKLKANLPDQLIKDMDAAEESRLGQDHAGAAAAPRRASFSMRPRARYTHRLCASQTPPPRDTLSVYGNCRQQPGAEVPVEAFRGPLGHSPRLREGGRGAPLRPGSSRHSWAWRPLQDGAGNVVIRKPARPGREGAIPAALQGHLDMVCEKNEGTAHNFDTDPIRLVLDGDWLRADGTTLGADNGVGVAAALAVMESTGIAHGPLEFVFTIDEESGLTGASQFPGGLLRSRFFLNLDGEEEGTLCIGCAGGLNTVARRKMARFGRRLRRCVADPGLRPARRPLRHRY